MPIHFGSCTNHRSRYACPVAANRATQRLIRWLNGADTVHYSARKMCGFGGSKGAQAPLAGVPGQAPRTLRRAAAPNRRTQPTCGSGQVLRMLRRAAAQQHTRETADRAGHGILLAKSIIPNDGCGRAPHGRRRRKHPVPSVCEPLRPTYCTPTELWRAGSTGTDGETCIAGHLSGQRTEAQALRLAASAVLLPGVHR